MVEICTRCGQRFLANTPMWSNHQCGSCLARQFEEQLAEEIQRATAQMPPRRERAAWRPPIEPAASAR